MAMPGDTTEKTTRVLVIEDNSAVRTLIEEVLADAGYQVYPFDDVPDLSAVQQLEPDLILLDVFIRGNRCGLEYLRELRSISALQRVPVIVCSGDEPGLRELSSMQPPLATDVLRKPIDLINFLGTVSSVIKKGHPVPSAESSGDDHRLRSPRRLFAGSALGGHGKTDRHERGRRRAIHNPEIRAWLLDRARSTHQGSAQEP